MKIFLMLSILVKYKTKNQMQIKCNCSNGTLYKQTFAVLAAGTSVAHWKGYQTVSHTKPGFCYQVCLSCCVTLAGEMLYKKKRNWASDLF